MPDRESSLSRAVCKGIDELVEHYLPPEKPDIIKLVDISVKNRVIDIDH